MVTNAATRIDVCPPAPRKPCQNPTESANRLNDLYESGVCRVLDFSQDE